MRSTGHVFLFIHLHVFSVFSRRRWSGVRFIHLKKALRQQDVVDVDKIRVLYRQLKKWIEPNLYTGLFKK